MIEHYIGVEENGAEGALKKARTLRDEMGYRILSIEHTQVPMAGSSSTPYSSTWGKTELGYYITVDIFAELGGEPLGSGYRLALQHR